MACHERMIQKEMMSLGLYHIHMMLKGFLVKNTREDRPRCFHEERKRIDFPFGCFFANEVVGFLVSCSFFYLYLKKVKAQHRFFFVFHLTQKKNLKLKLDFLFSNFGFGVLHSQ